jgi:autotransporter adhesin
MAESHSRAVADAQTLSQANDYTNKKFNNLKSEVDGNKKEAAAGSASAMAQANIPQVQESQQFAVGAGVGGYDSQNALSVGASFHASRSTIVKMSVSDDTQSNFGYGAGVSVGW